MFAVVVPKKSAQVMRKLVEEMSVWDDTRKLQLVGNDVAIPVVEMSSEDTEDLIHRADLLGVKTRVDNSVPLTRSKKQTLRNPHTEMVQRLKRLCEDKLGSLDAWHTHLHAEVPRKWEVHGGLVLLPHGSFSHQDWELLGPDLWSVVSSALKGRVAVKSSVTNDPYRTPQVQLVHGSDSWVTHVDNKIRYSYDAGKCMFSSGNITEKLRIANMNCHGEVIVDLYAGIGYFTLPYLVHAGAAHVHACEWNAAAAQALRFNLRDNNVDARCTVLEGDNREVCPVGVADRVNLGLIPSSERGWAVACAALKPDSGGVLHVHGNVTAHGKFEQKNCRQNCTSLASETSDVFECGKYGKSRLNNVPSDKVSTSSSVTSVETISPVKEAEESEDGCSNGDHLRTKAVEQCTIAESTACAGNDPLCSECAKSCPSECLWECNQWKLKPAWREWGERAARSLHNILVDLHNSEWTCKILHVEHVKSYAPHVDHMVVDVRCVPESKRDS